MVYTYNISTSVVIEVIPDNEDNDKIMIMIMIMIMVIIMIMIIMVIIKLYHLLIFGAIITYYNDIANQKKGDSMTLKIMSKAKPYYIYHHIYDYQKSQYLPLQFLVL